MLTNNGSQATVEIVVGDDGRQLVKKIMRKESRAYYDPVLKKMTRDKILNTIEVERDAGLLVNTLNSDHFCRFISASDDHILMSYIEGVSLHKHIGYRTKPDVAEELRRSLVGRVLVAAAIMNEELGVFHNDLHANNILVEKTNCDVQAYVFGDGDEFSFRTYGLNPVIIDFGLAFIASSKRMNTSPEHISLGIFPHEADTTVDARRLNQNAPCDLFDTIPEIDEHTGIFKDDTFPNFLDNTLPADELYILTSQIKMPLEKNGTRVNDQYCDFAEKVSESRKNLLDKINIKTARDAARRVFCGHHQFANQDVVRIYKNKKTHIVVINDDSTAENLNNNIIRISDLI